MVNVALVALAIGVGIGIILYLFTNDNEGPPHEEEEMYLDSGHSPSTRRASSQFTDYANECPICLHFMTFRAMVQLDPCLHLYHTDCMLNWQMRGPMDVRNCCPICRTPYKNLIGLSA